MSGVIAAGSLSGEQHLEVEAVVIGTGAGGSMMLRELAAAGVNVVGLEAGPLVRPSDFDQREDHMLPLLFEDGGGRSTDDLAIRILQGRGVGGSTLHNTNLCKRAPDELLERWAAEQRVSGLRPRDLDALYEATERDLSVTAIPEAQQNANNRVFRRGVEALGWRGGPLRHNRVGCRESGFCELGCAYDAKQNGAKVLIPEAVAKGATVYAQARADRVVHRRGSVVGVTATTLSGTGLAVGTLRLSARTVVVAAGAVASPVLLRASDVPDPHAQLGRSLRIHPGAAVAGRFDEPVFAYKGIPQAYECTEWLDFGPKSDRRVWLLPAFAHPVGAASTLPGFGASHMGAMRGYANLAVASAMVHDETSGEVLVDGDGRPSIRYRLGEADRVQLARGLVACARILLAAGAREVTFPSLRPVTVRSPRELDALDTSFIRPHELPITAVHPMGTLRLGDDPRRSVVRSNGAHHRLAGLFVADASLFPTSLGVPPQLSVYTFARHVARAVVDYLRTR